MQKTRHQCMIYDGAPGLNLPRLIPLLIGRVEEGYRCLFLGSPAMVADMRVALAAARPSLADEMRRNAIILTSDQSHLRDGQFDSKRMISALSDMTTAALTDGYKGLWASGDMTWEMGTAGKLVDLLSYECALESYFRRQPALCGVCIYHRDTLPLDMIGKALYTHPSLYINHTLQRVNPYYLQPDSLARRIPNPGEAEIRSMIEHVALA
jgi:hypothetical protein